MMVTPVLAMKLLHFALRHLHTNGLVQDCSIYIANALEILQSCTKLSILSASHLHSVTIVRTPLPLVQHDVQGSLWISAEIFRMHGSHNAGVHWERCMGFQSHQGCAALSCNISWAAFVLMNGLAWVHSIWHVEPCWFLPDHWVPPDDILYFQE